MNSLTQSANAKMTTVRIPGSEMGKTIRRSALLLEQPSTSAASSSSWGIVLKNPIRSQVEKGIVKDGYTRIRASSESWMPSRAITGESGREKSGGGTRETRKEP